jgi:hypothetical protein
VFVFCHCKPLWLIAPSGKSTAGPPCQFRWRGPAFAPSRQYSGAGSARFFFEECTFLARVRDQTIRPPQSALEKVPIFGLSGPVINDPGFQSMRHLFLRALVAVFAITTSFESEVGPADLINSHTIPLAPTTLKNLPSFGDLLSPDSNFTAQSIGAYERGLIGPITEKLPPSAELPVPPRDFCDAMKEAAEESDIPIAFFLWQESRFRSQEISLVGAQGVAQFMPATAAEVGLDDPFDPLKALPASARFLRKLHDQFGNLGLAAAAYNAGSGRIKKWLSRQDALPKETRAYVKIITGNSAEDWTEGSKTVPLRTQLPLDAPCEGIGGLSKVSGNGADVPVVLAPSVSALIKKADAKMQRLKAAKLTAARTAKAIVAELAKKPTVSVRYTALNGGPAKAADSLRRERHPSQTTHPKQSIVATKAHGGKMAEHPGHLRLAFAVNH